MICIESIAQQDNLYQVLGVSKEADFRVIRSSYLKRSKLVHPDRSNHKLAKLAFQKLSSAYRTLSDPSSRSLYDLYGIHSFDSHTSNTFSNAIKDLFSEFIDANYHSLVKIIDYIHSINPDLNIDRKSAHRVFSSVRDFCRWSSRCWGGMYTLF